MEIDYTKLLFLGIGIFLGSFVPLGNVFYGYFPLAPKKHSLVMAIAGFALGIGLIVAGILGR